MNKDKAKKIICKPWTHIIFLFLLMSFVFLNTRVSPQDDGFLYQEFAKKLAQGKIDFSIPGFHGADFFGAIIFLVTGSHLSIYFFDIICALLLIPLIYLAVKEIFQDKLLGVMAAYLYLLMPFDYFNAFRGGHQTAFFLFFVLALYLLFKNSKLTFLVYGFSLITKPFSIALLPFFIYKKKMKQFFLSLIIPITYIFFQFQQTGKLMIGVHPNLTTTNLFDLKRLFPNLIYAFQNYFSIHNFSPLNNLYLMDMVHISPLITVLAMFLIFYPKKYLISRSLYITLLSSLFIALLIPASFHSLNMWYLLVFNFILVLLALKALVYYKRLIPLVVFSFSFQFFYNYLSAKGSYFNNYVSFIIPLIIFLISLVFVFNYRQNEDSFSSAKL